MRPPRFSRASSFAVAVAALLSTQAVQAGSSSWNTNAAGSWTTAGSWNSGVPGASSGTASADIATFGFILPAGRAITVDAYRNIGGITFSNTSSYGYTLKTGTLYLTSGGTIQTAAANGTHADLITSTINIADNAGSGNFTANATSTGSIMAIAGSVNGMSTVGSTTTLTLNGTNTGGNTLSGAVSDGVSFGNLKVNKSGAGNWNLGISTYATTGGDNNIYSGGTSVNQGSLTLLSPCGLGGGSGGTTVASGASLVLFSSSDMDITTGEALTLSGLGLSSGGALVNNITGTATWGGTVTLGADTRINSVNGTLDLINTGTITGSGFNLTLGGLGNIQIESVIGTGGGTLTKDGAGTVTLFGSSTYTGATMISAGVLNIQADTAFGTTAGGVTVSSGAALEIQGVITVGNESLNIGGTGVSSAGALRNVSGNNTYGGLLTLSAATRINSDTGALTLSNSGTITGASYGLTVGGDGDTSIASIIGTTSGTLTKDGIGTLTLSGASTYTGTTTIQAGVLSINSIKSVNGGSSAVGAPTTSTNGTIAIGSTTTNANLTYTGGVQTTDRIIDLAGSTGGATIDQSGTGLLKFTSALTATGVGAKTLTLQGSSAGTGEIAGAIVDSSGGATSLIKTGSSTWALSGTSTYTGATLISGGTLQIGSGGTSGKLSTSSPITDNGTLAFNRTDALLQGTDFYNVITGTGGNVIQAGTGTTTLGNSNTYSGATTISAGKLSIATLADGAQTSSIGNSSNAAANLVLDGGTLQYTGTDVSTDRGFTITAGKAGIIEVTSNKLTISGASATTSGSLTKTGSGTLELTAVNGYTGGTLVSAGTLKVNNNPALGSGTGSGAVSIATTATLMGTGKVGGNLTVDSGGTLSPGNSPGILSVAGDVTLSSGSIFKWELSDNTITQTGTSPSTYDQVAMTGALSVSGATINLVFNSTGSTVNFTDTFWNSSHSWAVFTGFTGSTGTGFSTITTTSDSQIPSNLDTVNHPLGNFWYNTSNGTINWAVPEPSNVLAGLLLGAGLLRRRRDVKF
ncbi:MAG: autotransporter-associated beta strand repeat-containing protein [Verrucomicrobiota bacterium]